MTFASKWPSSTSSVSKAITLTVWNSIRRLCPAVASLRPSVSEPLIKELPLNQRILTLIAREETRGISHVTLLVEARARGVWMDMSRLGHQAEQATFPYSRKYHLRESKRSSQSSKTTLLHRNTNSKSIYQGWVLRLTSLIVSATRLVPMTLTPISRIHKETLFSTLA